MDAEIEAIEQVVRDAEEFQSDVVGFTALLTEEVSLVNFTGTRLRGREQVKKINDGRTGKLTFVLVKDSGTWRIALAQTTPVVTS